MTSVDQGFSHDSAILYLLYQLYCFFPHIFLRYQIVMQECHNGVIIYKNSVIIML